jgi:hypothetical protein
LLVQSLLVQACGGHIQLQHSYPVIAENLRRTRVDPKISDHLKVGNLPADRSVSPRQTKGKNHAFDSTPRSSHCGGCSSLVGEPFHPDAGIHQINIERRRRNRRCSVAHECFWPVPFAFQNPRWMKAIWLAKSNADRITSKIEISQCSNTGSRLP